MATRGSVYSIEMKEFEWRIRKFSSLPGRHVDSPTFSFGGEQWHLRLYPEGQSESTAFLDLYLHRLFSVDHKINLEFSMGLKTVDGDKYPDFHKSFVFDMESNNFGESEILSRYDLYYRESDYLPRDVLTVFCTMYYPIYTGNAKTEQPVASEKLCDDLKQIMTSGDHSDTTIKVKGEDFRLHRSILGARSPFFDSMFKTEMRENITGVVPINDCEPETFRSYIHFLYSGKIGHISPEKVCDLYEVADRYQEDQLKEECLQFMLNSISLDSFCDYTIFAYRHNEEKLLKGVTKFFISTTKEIIRSARWQNFLLECPIQANELYIKAFDLNCLDCFSLTTIE